MVDWAHSHDVFVVQSVETLEEIVAQLCDPPFTAANVCTLPLHTHTRMYPPMCTVGVSCTLRGLQITQWSSVVVATHPLSSFHSFMPISVTTSEGSVLFKVTTGIEEK